MKTKKILIILLAVLLVLSLGACGGGNKKAIVGSWKLTDGDGGEYGVALVFNKDGTMSYGFDIDWGEGDEAEELEDAMEDLKGLLTIEYKVKSDTMMKITVKALMGLASESTEVEYQLDGDTLVFDGSTYQRLD